VSEWLISMVDLLADDLSYIGITTKFFCDFCRIFGCEAADTKLLIHKIIDKLG